MQSITTDVRGNMPTLAELQERLTLYRDAERAVLQGHQSYTIGSQQFTRANLSQIQAMIRTLEQQVATHPSNAVSGGRLSHSQTIFGGRR